MVGRILAAAVLLSFTLSACGTFDPAKRMGRQNIGVNFLTLQADIDSLKRMGRPIPPDPTQAR